MEEAVAVNVVQGRSNLLDYVPDFFMRKRVIIELSHLHHAVQVHVQKFEHHVQRVVMPDHLEARHNVLVFQADHGLDLGVPHRSLPRRELSFKGLQCVYLFCLLVCDLVDDSEAALAERFEHSETLDQESPSRVRLERLLRIARHVL